MQRPGSRASAALALLFVAAGSNIFCGSSTSTSALNTSVTVTSGRPQSGDQIVTTISSPVLSSTSVTAAPTTLPVTTVVRLTEQNTTIVSTVTVPEVEGLTTILHSRTLNTTITIADASTQPSTGHQTTEDALTSGISGRSTESTISHLDTLPYVSSAATESANVTELNSTSSTWMPSKETSASTSTTSKQLSTTEATSGETPEASTLPGSEKQVTSSQVTQAGRVTSETSPTEGSTFSVGVTMQEIKHALSSGSIAAITIAVIALVLLVFSMAAFLKIRHSSYGRLLDDHEYGSWGNYNNPLYDDS